MRSSLSLAVYWVEGQRDASGKQSKDTIIIELLGELCKARTCMSARYYLERERGIGGDIGRNSCNGWAIPETIR